MGTKLETEFELPMGVSESRANAKKQQAIKRPPRKSEFVYFDLETVPDYERVELFDLPRAPVLAKETGTYEMAAIEGEPLGLTIGALKNLLQTHNPSSEWLSDLSVAEAQGKNRKGVMDAINSHRKTKRSVVEHEDSIIKLMSVTPEYCKVAACAFQTSNNAGAYCDPEGEAGMLQKLWRFLDQGDTVVGFNILAFDLPVLYFRSALLGLDVPRRLDLRKYGSRDVLDVFKVLFDHRNTSKAVDGWRPRSGLKDQCRLTGVERELLDDGDVAADVDGSQVHELVANGEFETVREYAAMDVRRVALLHRFYQGLYWV